MPESAEIRSCGSCQGRGWNVPGRAGQSVECATCRGTGQQAATRESAAKDDRANVVIRIPARDLSRLQAWMSAGHVVSELHITGQPPIECDVEEAWAEDA